MAYAGRLISFYRLFDLNSLVEVAHYMSYKQSVYGTLLGHSASSNQHLKFLQHSVANYLIPNIHQSNWTKLKIPYSHYKFGSSIDGDIGFKIIGNKFQSNESNIRNINFLQKLVVNVGPIVTGDGESKGKSNLLNSTFLDDEVIFRTKLKEMIAKVDSVLEKKEEVERLKQSKKIDEIAQKLDEFIKKNILAEKYNEAKNPKIEPEKVYSLVVYQSAKQYKFNHYNNVKNPINLPNSTLHVQN